ncbi:MAG: hypothetical protein FWD25_03545 [Clostridia bacterium]|nr:hypothetical protein [Clostridia bacterium]
MQYLVTESKWNDFRKVFTETAKNYNSIAIDAVAFYVIKAAYKCFGKALRPRYEERLSKHFNKRYYYKNMLKSLISLWYLEDLGVLRKNEHVIDVGCGGSPSILAYMIVQKKEKPLNAELIDKSNCQIAIAEKLLGNNCEITTHVHDFSFEKSNFTNNSFVIMSYFLCEQSKHKIKNIVEHLEFGENDTLVIDYRKNIEKLHKKLRIPKQKKLYTWSLRTALPFDITLAAGEGSIHVSGLYVKSTEGS